MKEGIIRYCESRKKEFERIPESRKLVLEKISSYLRFKQEEEVNLLVLEEKHQTNGHLLQVWFDIAASLYQYEALSTLSAGLEKDMIDVNCLHTMLDIGFDIECLGTESNPIYVFYSEDKSISKIVSKELDEIILWPESFSIIYLTESQAKLSEAEFTANLDYPSPMWSEGTAQQAETYHKLIGQISREMLFVFNQI